MTGSDNAPAEQRLNDLFQVQFKMLTGSTAVADIPQAAKDAANEAIIACWQTHPNTPAPDPHCCIPAGLAAALPHLGEVREEWALRHEKSGTTHYSMMASRNGAETWLDEDDPTEVIVHRTVITTPWQETR